MPDRYSSLIAHLTLQALIQDLKALSDNCRSNSCIEHATGIMEDEGAPERLSKGVSTMSLGDNKRKVCFIQGFCPHKHLMRLQSVSLLLLVLQSVSLLLLVFRHVVPPCWSLICSFVHVTSQLMERGWGKVEPKFLSEGYFHVK